MSGRPREVVVTHPIGSVSLIVTYKRRPVAENRGRVVQAGRQLPHKINLALCHATTVLAPVFNCGRPGSSRSPMMGSEDPVPLSGVENWTKPPLWSSASLWRVGSTGGDNVLVSASSTMDG